MENNTLPTAAPAIVLFGHRVPSRCPKCAGHLLWAFPRETSLLREGPEATCVACGRERSLLRHPVVRQVEAAQARERFAHLAALRQEFPAATAHDLEKRGDRR